MAKKIISKIRGSKKGFTLIELIVVIAILAALAALALPTMSGIIGSADEQVAEANARTVYTAAQTYFIQNPDETSADKDDLKKLLGDGMTGDYSATGEDGACKKATWIGEKYTSTYDPSKSTPFDTKETSKNSK